MDSFERFNEDQFPSNETFYSSLKYESMSDEDYALAQDVF